MPNQSIYRPHFSTRLIGFMQNPILAILGVVFLFTGLKWGAFLFTVHQYEMAIVTRFGKAIRTEKTPGLKFKVPFIDAVHRFDNRILAWDGPPTECPTKDKLYLIVDCFARWQISDPLLYYNRLNDERSALSRLDDILGSETRTAVASNDLVEIVRLTKGREPLRDAELEKTGTVLPSNLPDIERGRGKIEEQITERAREKIEGFGIELLDERFKRSKYSPAVAEKIIERMSSERHQIASKFRSEGRGEAANINGQKESDVASIQSQAQRKALKIEGEADAEAARIYAAAYSTPEAQSLYSFVRRLEVAREAFGQGSTAVFSTASDFGAVLKTIGQPGPGSAPGTANATGSNP
jgi:membrane protease subunit HflC